MLNVRMLLAACLLLGLQSFAKADDVGADSVTATSVSVAIAPIAPIENISFQTKSSHIGLLALPEIWANRGAEKDRVAELKHVIEEAAFEPRAAMRDALASELMQRHVKVSLNDDIRYVANDPDTIDYKATQSDATYILNVLISDMGVCSNRLSSRFIPRLNVYFNLVEKKTAKPVYTQSIYYGADAQQDGEDQITVGPKYAFDTPEDVFAMKAELIDAWRDGIAKIARLAASQIQAIR